MRVLVACEFSGCVRDAFLRAGHDAISCDLLPSETPGPHHQGDVLPLLQHYWDLVIAHPPCTYLANSGVRWLHERADRWPKLFDAAAFFRACMDANATSVCIENPVMHRYGVQLIGQKHSQTVQPWQFGHGETKRVCLWLKKLPNLRPTNVVDGRVARVHQMPPSADRQKERSRFFTGIADAMASQWTPRDEVAA